MLPSRRNAALIAYYFPPLGGGGTDRARSFAKWLPRLGIPTTVFTVQTHDLSGDREFQIDSSIESTHEARIERVRSCRRSEPTTTLDKILAHPMSWAIGYRWKYCGHRAWAMRVRKAIIKAQSKKPFDIIIATAGPFSALEAAASAAKAIGVPWIADLRDPWNSQPLKHYPSYWHAQWESRFEKRILRTASAIIMNTPGSCQAMKAWLGPSLERRVTWISNGFDSDQPRPQEGKDTRNPSSRFVITHSGTLLADGVRASRPGRYFRHDINDSARSLTPLAHGVRALINRNPGFDKVVRIKQMGYCPDTVARAAKSIIPESDVFQFEGIRPKNEVAEAIKDADALLVVQVAWADRSMRVPHIPGKTFDYIASGKPIIALAPPGDLFDLLRRIPQAIVMHWWDVEAICAALERLLQRKPLKCRPQLPLDQSQLTREYQARQLASIVGDVLKSGGFQDCSPPDYL